MTSNESGGSIVLARTARAGEGSLDGGNGVALEAGDEEVDLIIPRSVELTIRRVGEEVSTGGVSFSLWDGRDEELGLPIATCTLSARMSIDEVGLCEVDSTTLLESELVAGGINWCSTPVVPVTLREMLAIDLGTSVIAIWGMMIPP